jgi:hypothetical protein
VPFKSELVVEVQGKYGCLGFHAAMVREWRALIAVVGKCDKLIVLGYSFPPEDTHATHFFREAARRRRGRKLAIEVFERNMGAFASVAGHVEAIFAMDIQALSYLGPVQP